MNTFWKALGVALVSLSLWGCGGQPQSETSTQNEATVQEAQATEKSTTTQTPMGTRPFITKWKGEAGKSIEIPALGTYTLTWYNETTPNERHTEQVTVTTIRNNSGEETASPYIFTPPTDGIYVVEAGAEGVEGMLMSFDNVLNIAPKLLSVVQFGDVVWKKLYRAFNFCSNMRFEEGIDTPNLSQCTDLEQMFRGCKVFNSPLAHWDVSKITNMRSMFDGCEAFNQPLECWDVSQVTEMSSMF